MQASRLAVSADSVYIVGPDDQLRFIRRAEEGLWGPWQEAGVPALEIVHAGHDPSFGRARLIELCDAYLAKRA